MSLKRPVKFFVEVKLNEVPVLDARVKVHVDVINLSGQKTDGVWIDLLDNGNGGTVHSPGGTVHSLGKSYIKWPTNLDHL